MTTRVYQYGLRAPTTNARLVRDQLRAAHDYENDLRAIERGRRWALREVDDTPEVAEAVALVRASTKSTRRAAVVALRRARKAARDAAPERLAEIAEREHELLLSARANTSAFWGTYLDVEAAHRQSRQAPLYGDDAIEPNDPKFVRWSGIRPAEARVGRLPESSAGQLGIQLQGGLATKDALAGMDTRCRLVLQPVPAEVTSKRGQGRRFGELSIRVGSDGRDPVWATWPILVHRCVPDAAVWKWVRVSLRHEGRHEKWTCEISVDDPSPAARDADKDLTGAIAVEWEWSPLEDGSIRVARWADDRGGTGNVLMPTHLAVGIRKPDGHRAVRDILANDARPKIQRAIREDKGPLPTWLAQDGATLHLWKSHTRLHALHRRWVSECPAVCPKAFALVEEWVRRDRHLWDYEAGMRGQTLRARRDWYRRVAAQWAREYRTALLSDQDLSREARFGPDADVRQTAGVSELRAAVRNAFALDALDGRREKPKEDEAPWCERARDAWMAGGAREGGMFATRKAYSGNAWQDRKEKAAAKRAEKEAARNASGNAAE
jgi:hypothetical protein